jgi:chromosomal replication initiation ATPase DnaA
VRDLTRAARVVTFFNGRGLDHRADSEQQGETAAMNNLKQRDDHRMETVWWRTRERLRAEMGPQRFAYWIASLRVLTVGDERVAIVCRSPYFRDQTTAKFGTKITNLIAEYAPQIRAVDFVVDPAAENLRPVAPSVLDVKCAPELPVRRRPAAKDCDAALGERRILIEHIKRVVAEHHKVTTQDLESPCRKRAVVRPRQIAMYFARELSGRSFPEIARRFGGRDHTTSLHGCKKIRLDIAANPLFAAELEAVKRLILHTAASESKSPQEAASEFPTST